MTTRNPRFRPRREGRGRYYQRRLVCPFCVDSSLTIDYKDVITLRRFISDRARIEPRRRTGACAKHQRVISKAIKRARSVALLPFSSNHEFTVSRTAPQEAKAQAKSTEEASDKEEVAEEGQQAEAATEESVTAETVKEEAQEEASEAKEERKEPDEQTQGSA